MRAGTPPRIRAAQGEQVTATATSPDAGDQRPPRAQQEGHADRLEDEPHVPRGPLVEAARRHGVQRRREAPSASTGCQAKLPLMMSVFHYSIHKGKTTYVTKLLRI